MFLSLAISPEIPPELYEPVRIRRNYGCQNLAPADYSDLAEEKRYEPQAPIANSNEAHTIS